MANSFEEWRTTEEMEATYTMPEASEAIKATIINMGEVSRDKPILLACSDDRPPTGESSQAMLDASLPMDRPYLKIFGGGYGAGNVLLIATTAQYGAARTKQELGNNYFGFMADFAHRVKRLGVIPAIHSDDKSEGNPSSLDIHSGSALGCARASALGAINQVACKEQLAIRVGESDSEALLGPAFQIEAYNQIPAAVEAVSQTYYGAQPRAFGIVRGEALRAKMPAVVLKGKHATKNVEHVFNLKPDKVSDVNEAAARGVHYYHTDLVPVAEVILRSYPELNLDPAILMQTIILDAAATRMPLSALDSGQPDPTRIKAVRYGNGAEALDYLYEVKQSLS